MILDFDFDLGGSWWGVWWAVNRGWIVFLPPSLLLFSEADF
jgi:hypothetical protein